MVAEVSAVQTAKAEKVYSNDGMLYSGMTVNEANSDPTKMQIFASADIDKDNVISEEEMARYNGPTIEINYPERLGQIDGLKIVRTRTASNVVPFSENYSKDNVVSFYPGLKLDKVDGAGRVTFSQIDKDKDGVLSVYELKEAEQFNKKTDESCKKITMRPKDIASTAVFGPLFGAIAGFFSHAITEGLALELGIGSAAAAGPIAVGIGALVCLGIVGYGVYSFIKNNKIQKETEQMISDTGNQFGKFLYETKLKPTLEGKQVK